ncbi:hypothetical protein HER32_00210 [Hymenobacter sp. BT18]|uniref:hypothetical protein n=1 Tax=Hymenobacter sp. BT18 TaxID=2835648 RepID=UPI00143E9652|nr:hypothetical protein [Hymenobacter sp. BT18]QIX59698.1 hypothetical protein HER32_00210 [Hymenobacter sp. BT18]
MALPKSTPALGSKVVESLLKEMQAKILQADIARVEAGGKASAKNKVYVQALQEAREMLQDMRYIGAPAHKLQQGIQGTLMTVPIKQPAPTPGTSRSSHYGS